MAPLPVDDVPPLKRTSSTADFDLPAAKKQQLRPTRHHHKLQWNPDYIARHQTSPQDEEGARVLLARSIVLALEAVGFESADPVAIESFRAEVEEYMVSFSTSVRQSMLHCRRTQPLPHDFLQSLHEHQLSLRALLPHLDPPVPAVKSQFSLAREIAVLEQQRQPPALNPLLHDHPDASTRPYIPKTFPAFPSEHTYRATPDVPTLHHDPRSIRERATEEGRLGEAALRKLVSSRSDERIVENAKSQRGQKPLRVKRDEAWKAAMDAAGSGQYGAIRKHNLVRESEEEMAAPECSPPSAAYISSAVNADKKFWRKPASRHRLD